MLTESCSFKSLHLNISFQKHLQNVLKTLKVKIQEILQMLKVMCWPLHGFWGQVLLQVSLQVLYRQGVGLRTVVGLLVVGVVQQRSRPRAHIVRRHHPAELRRQDLRMDQLVEAVQVVAVHEDLQRGKTDSDSFSFFWIIKNIKTEKLNLSSSIIDLLCRQDKNGILSGKRLVFPNQSL